MKYDLFKQLHGQSFHFSYKIVPYVILGLLQVLYTFMSVCVMCEREWACVSVCERECAWLSECVRVCMCLCVWGSVEVRINGMQGHQWNANQRPLMVIPGQLCLLPAKVDCTSAFLEQLECEYRVSTDGTTHVSPGMFSCTELAPL